MQLSIQALAEIERRKRSRRRKTEDESVQDFVVRISPKYERPEHLSSLTDLLEKAAGEGDIWACVHAPPRHGKTDTILHFIAWVLSRDPSKRIGYASYAARLASKKSESARKLTIKAGVKMDPKKKASIEWRTEAGGGLFAAGRGGPFTGEGFDIIVVDDPFKNRAEAESKVVRDACSEWFSSTVVSRLEPGGSIVVTHTRWHEDDLIGRLLTEDDEWSSVSLQAIGDDGQALWPSRWPARLLAKRRKRLSDIDWWSLFQGSPRPRGGAVFQGTTFYRELPSSGRRGAGLDFAYTAKTHSDWNVIVEGLEHAGRIYITHVTRKRCQSHEWRDELRTRRRMRPHDGWSAYCSGVERGVVDLLNDQADLGILVVPASTDKLIRSQPAATMWNVGDILVPDPEEIGAPWLSDFLSEVLAFTGLKDKHDDQVDGLAGLVESLGAFDDDFDDLDPSAFDASDTVHSSKWRRR